MLTVADTAYSIAVVRAEESGLPEAQRLFDDPYAALFGAAGAHAAEGTKRYLELPFFRDGIRLRTRYIDEIVREGLAAGLTQLVLFGAGFDARGLRMPDVVAHDVAVFEIDLQAQLEHKRALLADAGVPIPARIAYVACDFTADGFEEALSEALAKSGFRAGDGALFVWEGVVGYLDDAAVDRSLAFMARAGGPKSRVVFDFAPQDRFDPEAVVRRAGFTECSSVGYEQLWRRWLQGEPHPSAWACRMALAAM